MEYRHTDSLCPVSGIGQHPVTWGRCYSRCAWFDFEANACALLVLVDALRDLPLEAANVSALQE